MQPATALDAVGVGGDVGKVTFASASNGSPTGGLDDVQAALDAGDSAPASGEEVAPTLNDAFVALCRAVQYNLEDMPDLARVADVRRMYHAGDHVGAWRHLIDLLEGVVGAPLRIT